MFTSQQKYSLTTRLYTAFFALLGISVILSFRMGDFFTGDFREFYFSYVANILAPIGIYFILCILEIQFSILRTWYAKAFLVIIAASMTEFMQAAGIPILGMTYDLVDLYMIILGAMIAAAVDVVLFERLLPYWKYDRKMN